MTDSNRTLLLVDDEENILRSLKRLFRREGYSILTANSGQEGLELLKEHDVSVILSDQRMPNMNGTEFLKLAKEQCPSSVRIVLSGYTDLESITDAINEGAIFKFLTKPWEDDLLKKNIKEAFEVYALKEQNDQLTLELTEINNKLAEANIELQKAAEEKEQLIAVRTQFLQTTQEMFEKIPVGLLSIDSQQMITIYNQAFLDSLTIGLPGVMGMQAEKVLPDSIMSMVNNEDDQHIQTIESNNKQYQCHVTKLRDPSGLRGHLVVLLPVQ